MDISDLKEQPLFGNTWNDRKGTSQEYLRGSTNGPRVVVHRWLDTNEVVVTAMTGNAFKNPSKYKEFFKRSLMRPTPSQVRNMVIAAAKRLPGGRT